MHTNITRTSNMDSHAVSYPCAPARLEKLSLRNCKDDLVLHVSYAQKRIPVEISFELSIHDNTNAPRHEVRCRRCRGSMRTNTCSHLQQIHSNKNKDQPCFKLSDATTANFILHTSIPRCCHQTGCAL